MPEWTYPFIGAFLIGMAKAGFATGLGMLTTPLLTTVMPARQVIGVILPLLIVADLMTLSVFWKKWDLSLVRIPMLGSLLGIAAGMSLVNGISDRFLRVSIGATALVLTVLLLVRNLWYPARVYRPSAWEAALVGLAAGFSSTISHGAGPIMAIFLIAQKPDKRVFVASNGLFFTLLNLLKLPPYILSGLVTRETLILDLRLLPVIPLGVLAGWLGNRALPQKAFEVLVYVLLLLTSLQLLFG